MDKASLSFQFDPCVFHRFHLIIRLSAVKGRPRTAGDSMNNLLFVLKALTMNIENPVVCCA